MSKKVISVVLLFSMFFGFNALKAQEVLNGVFVQSHVISKKPVPYQYVREADVMWSKTVWRKIQLKEKINHPLYYPERIMGERMSLMSLLLWGIKNQGLTAYDEDVSTGDEFAVVMSQEQIQERLGAKKEYTTVTDVETGEVTERVVEGEAHPEEIKELLLKEVWFFDKQRSVMEVRIVGICPIRMYKRDPNDPDAKLEPMKVFWIYYPEARKILANHYVFNSRNNVQAGTFDELFLSRRFSSYITRESNVYNDRPISQYTIGLESMLEAERIKENIYNYEQDLWHY